jgi:hypothetical protein
MKGKRMRNTLLITLIFFIGLLTFGYFYTIKTEVSRSKSIEKPEIPIIKKNNKSESRKVVSNSKDSHLEESKFDMNINIPSLGGIHLRDTQDSVLKLLGTEYIENTVIDDAGIWGEDLISWSYNEGIEIHFGSDSKIVRSIIAKSEKYETNMKAKVGDRAESIFSLYDEQFKELFSIHDEIPLRGWYEVAEGIIMIFDFDSDDNTRVNRIIMKI